MGIKDLEMMGESVMKHPEKWANIAGMPLDELKDQIEQCKGHRRICGYNFGMMHDIDCSVQAGLNEAFMRGAGMIVTDESFDEFIASTAFEWWEEHILPSRERIMINLFGEDAYGIYEEISLDEHWN